jgi:hypothetical protein
MHVLANACRHFPDKYVQPIILLPFMFNPDTSEMFEERKTSQIVKKRDIC